MTEIELTINGESKRVRAGLTVADLLRHLERDPRRLAVEVNLELVPREVHPRHELHSGDRVEILTLVGGG